MAYIKIKTDTVRDVKVDFYVETRELRHKDLAATFLAVREGQDPKVYSNLLGGSSATLEELMKRLKQTLREKVASVSVPFEMLKGREVKAGVARGIHQKDHDILVTWADGTKDQISNYREETLRPLTKGEREAVLHAAMLARDASEQADRAQRWLDKLIEPFEVKLDNLVREAIAERTKQMAAMEEAVADAQR